MQIDVATTATLRPELLDRTYKSFEPMFRQHDDWRLILHIDEAGDTDSSWHEIVEVAEKYFSTIKVIATIFRPDFRLAWRRCVQALANRYVFWLEDDWELVQPIDFTEMLRIMEGNPDLASLRLPRWESGAGTFRQWNKRQLDATLEPDFFRIPPENVCNCGYSNNPSLTRKDFLQPVLPYLDPVMDPEKQIGGGFNGVCRNWLARWQFGVFQKPNSPAVVQDIGEAWRKKRRLGKGNKMQFSTWEKQDNARP